MKDVVLRYLGDKLSGAYPASYLVSLVLVAAAVMFISVVALHAFIPSPQPLFDVLIHAVAIALTYTVTIALAVAALMFLKPASIQVWQIWLVSVVIYGAGFWLSQFVDAMTSQVKYQLHPDLDPDDGLFHFLRLIPIWFVMTFLLLGQLQRRELSEELIRLNEINIHLAKKPTMAAASSLVEIQSGKKVLTLDANRINCISVDDHYCSIYVDEEGGQVRHDVAQSLTEVEKLMPPQFIRVHRSHIVNLERANSVWREDRNLRLRVGDQGLEVPVSRNRSNTVLQHLDTTPGNALRKLGAE